MKTATTTYLWNSTDIWVRNQPDGLMVRQHENPEYDPGQPAYVYVRVTNKSCVTSSGSDKLKMYWAKANTSLTYPLHWNGTLYEQGVVMGDTIGTIKVPVMEPDQTVVLKFEWPVPNPDDYSFNPNPWHFCLLARLVSDDDPIDPTHEADLNKYVGGNNNIAWKNTTVVDITPHGIISGSVAMGNTSEETEIYTIEFVVGENDTEHPVFKEAEVSFEMDDVLYNAWERGGNRGENFESTRDDMKMIITGDHAVLQNVIMAPGELGLLNLNFNFLTREITENTDYTYHVIQKYAEKDKIFGGETYEIHRDPRFLFMADAGNNEYVDQNDTIVLKANDINEPATYNWYDPDGTLIYSGTDLTVSADITKKFRLEIIADSDGYKDYDDVAVYVTHVSLVDLVPNPATNTVTVSYEILPNTSSAYLMVTNAATTLSNNYILNVENSEISIDLSQYSAGVYVVSLITDGVVADTANLIKY